MSAGTAGLAAAGLGAAGSIGGALISSQGQQAAASTQAQAQQQQLSMAQPFINIGQAAGTELGNELAGGTLGQMAMPTNATIKSMPGYNFTMTQGLNAVQNSAASQGLGVSGNAQRAAAQFATGTAQQYYQNYFNDYWANQQNRYNMLAGLTGMGANAAVGAGTNLGSTAANMGGFQAGAGNALGSGVTGAGSSILNSALGANQINSQVGSGGLFGLNNLFGGGSSPTSAFTAQYGSLAAA
jgi:hypothetical protein